jgi:hypothetical protein
MTAHSLLGASGAHRWLNCPGSFKLSQQMPHRPVSIYAATGTLAHIFIQRAWEDRATTVNPIVLGRKYIEDGHTVDVDQDFIDGVNVMLDYLRTVDRGLTDVEVLVSLDHWFGKPSVPVFGTLDARVIDPIEDTLEIVDYKNGAGVSVTPVWNPQLLFYAAGALPPQTLSKLRQIKLTIVQPHAPGEPVKTWMLDAVDLLMWIDQVLVPGVLACDQDDGTSLHTGAWCRFCPVAHGCPKLHEDAVAAAKAEFDDVASINTDDELALALSQALDVAENAVLWAERLREFALYRAHNQGLVIPGWGVVPTRPTRQWVKDEKETAAELEQHGVPPTIIWEQRLRSPAQMEKRLPFKRLGSASVLVELRSSGFKLARTGDVGQDFTDD